MEEGGWFIRVLEVSRRVIIEEELRSDLVRRGVVLSLWWDSWGCWIIMICVLVGIAGVGMTWQRQTGIGRSHLWQIERRFGGGDGGLLSGSGSISDRGGGFAAPAFASFI